MKIIFMGTPDFAGGILDALIAGGHEVVLAVTQEDKPKGRGKALRFPPVKENALSYGIEVFQPHRIREAKNIEKLRQYQADLIVVAAYGQILPKEILEMTPYGCVNVHASLLPKYRGAAPIQWAIIDGETVTGVTTMKMDEGLDTGDMIDKKVVEIAPDETAGTLFDKLMEAGKELILETIAKLEAGTAVFTKQEDQLSCYAKMLKKEMGNIDFTKSAAEIERLVRGLNPWPSAYTSYAGKLLKIWSATATEGHESDTPGEIIRVEKDVLAVQTGDGILKIHELQLAGKKRMDTGAFLSGVHMRQGEILGAEAEQ